MQVRMRAIINDACNELLYHSSQKSSATYQLLWFKSLWSWLVRNPSECSTQKSFTPWAAQLRNLGNQNIVDEHTAISRSHTRDNGIDAKLSLRKPLYATSGALTQALLPAFISYICGSVDNLPSWQDSSYGRC